MTDTFPFERALKEAKLKLAEALEERLALERRIVSLKQTIEGLTPLCQAEAQDFVQPEGTYGIGLSLTSVIRTIFSESKQPILTPLEVRDALRARGVDLAKYKQPLVPIHNTLKRLETQEEIVAFRDDDGNVRGYRWISPLARAVAELDHRPKLGYPDPLNKRKK